MFSLLSFTLENIYFSLNYPWTPSGPGHFQIRIFCLCWVTISVAFVIWICFTSLSFLYLFFFLALNSFSHSVFLLFFFISFLFSSYPCYSKISYVILHQDLCCFWSNILLLPASPWNLCFSFSRTTFNSYSLTPICLLLLFICPFF